MISCKADQGGSHSHVAAAELLGIPVNDSFHLELNFPDYPDHHFSLWLPELVIFNKDSERKMLQSINGTWYEKDTGNVIVMGKTMEGARSLDFKCLLRPLSKSSVMLVLEVENTGTDAWSDYAQLAICLAPEKGELAFSDTSGAMSFIMSLEGEIIALPEAGTVEGYNHYPVGHRSDDSDTAQVTRIDDGFIGRTGSRGNTTISFMWNNSARVDVNPGGLDCIHSHPAIGPLDPGDSKIVFGFINIGPGDAASRYDIMEDLILEYESRDPGSLAEILQ